MKLAEQENKICPFLGCKYLSLHYIKFRFETKFINCNFYSNLLTTIKYLFYTIQNMNFNTREINIFKGLILTELDLIVLRKLSQATNQKSLSQDIGISVGKVNYIINALVDKGFVKATRFVNSKNKIQYKYILTPDGIVEKVNLTKIFIERKKAEYEELQKELEIWEWGGNC